MKFSNFISAPQGHEMKFKFHELFRVVIIVPPNPPLVDIMVGEG